MKYKKSNSNKSVEPLWNEIKHIFALSKPFWKRFYGALVFSLLATAVSLTIPLGLKALLDAVFQNGDTALLNLIAFVLMGLFILRAFFAFGSSYGLSWVGARVVTDLRKQLYRQLQQLGFRYYSEVRLGEISSRLTNDVSSVRTVLTDSFPQSVTVVFSLIGSVVLMVTLNWRLSLIILLTVPIVTITSRYFGNKIRSLARSIQDELADSTAIAEDTLSAISVVKAFARESYEVDRYSNSVEKLFNTSRKKILLTSLFWSGMGLLFMTTLVLIFWFGGREVLAGRLTTGDLVAFIFYAFSISRSIGLMSRLYTSLNSAIGASERIFDLLEEVPEIQNQVQSRDILLLEGAVSFQNVSFAYEQGRTVLENISFDVCPGQRIAVVGPSGVGKTTLINLIPRFYDPQKGKILVDQIDIKEFKKQSLRKQIGIVPQDVHLFGTTVRENILYGRLDATSYEIEQAATEANAMVFIRKLPKGLDSHIGEKGVKLSGGQRQRLAIARALLKNPQILLLDEATSSLDSDSEAQIQEALSNLMHNKTTFIIAHRLSTIQHADQILVLDRGKIVQFGSHEELITQFGLYKHLYELQFREEGTEHSKVG